MAGVWFTALQSRPIEFLDFTSMTLDEFQQLVPSFEAAFHTQMATRRMDGKPRTVRRFTVYQNCPLPTPEERLLFILAYVKTYSLQGVHGCLFGMVQGKTHQWMHVLFPALQQLTELRAQSAEVAEAIDLAQDFATLVRQRQPTQLDPWLQRATTRTLEALQRFAKGLRDDYDAVKAGVTLAWSTGPVEGHINRLKMLKRQMFGRARLDLLSRRSVLTPRGGQAQAVDPRAPAQVQAVAG